jgi:hypothetical protein
MRTASKSFTSSAAQRLALWLWVINLGVAVGAGIYESRIVVPEWLYVLPDGQWYWDAEAARQSDTGLSFWAYVSTGPLTLLTLINLVLAFRSTKPLRKVWLLAAGAGLLERCFTSAYFIPQMLKLMSGELSQAAAVPLAQQWQDLNQLRHVLLIVAWVVSLQAFAVASALARPKAE